MPDFTRLPTINTIESKEVLQVVSHIFKLSFAKIEKLASNNTINILSATSSVVIWTFVFRQKKIMTCQTTLGVQKNPRVK